MEHAKTCFARLTGCMLGRGSISGKKLLCGTCLVILGLEARLAATAFCCKPSGDKAIKWLARIEDAMNTRRLRAGDASKLAGALSWVASNLYERMGRGMLRPLFAQCHNRGGGVGSDLAVCLAWWRCVLRLNLYVVRRARIGARPPWVQLCATRRSGRGYLLARICLQCC